MLNPVKHLKPTNLFCVQVHKRAKLKATLTTTHKKEHFTTKDVSFYKYQKSYNLQAAAIRTSWYLYKHSIHYIWVLYYYGCGLQIFCTVAHFICCPLKHQKLETKILPEVVLDVGMKKYKGLHL